MALVLIPLSEVVDHPDNPRLFIRLEVIAALVATMGDEYPQEYAIKVRQKNGKYEIIAGHHRARAARQKGFTHIWAWVSDADDDSAFMELATSNNHGELSPLEIGIHALRAVPKGKAGRGKKGGLAAYAAKIGKNQGYLSSLVSAAEVLKSIGQPIDLAPYLDKAQHLAAIHALPPALWESACAMLIEKGLSVADLTPKIEQTKTFLHQNGISEKWSKEYLPVEKCAASVFAGTDPKNFERLSCLADEVAAKLPVDLAAEWEEWLVKEAGGDSWSIKLTREKMLALEEIAWEREHVGEEPAEEISVLLADPPWQYDLAETDNRQIENQYPTASVSEIITHINKPWMPPLAKDCVLYLWATAPKFEEALKVLEEWGFTYKTCAVWDKEKIGMGYWFREQHEMLLVGTKGKFSPPTPENRFSSVFREAREGHSEKPECVYKAIEKMFPKANKFEMYQRTPREGWAGGGNEVF